ncbi:MAG: FAD-dependent oxidoreductase [Elusimicrobia bacterium]|nr:FAD-dependent oxidoreductase [Elusimicrobiota bacterium]
MDPKEYDAIVIGGGITGAGILRDFALRGVRALLVEKGDLGCATTASSSHLIHGGLRYLLYDRLTTHATCWDSGHIVRIARPLLTRLPILWPVYRDHRRGLETVETLLESYDGFQP